MSNNFYNSTPEGQSGGAPSPSAGSRPVRIQRTANPAARPAPQPAPVEPMPVEPQPVAPAPVEAAPQPEPEENAAAPLFGGAVFYDQDKDLPTKKKSKNKKGSNLIFILLLLLFGSTFLISGGVLINRFLGDRQARNDFDNLKDLIATPAPNTGEVVEEDNSIRFEALLAQNPDFMGWINIEGTDLDYPVMYRPDYEDYYLKRDFNKEYSRYGVPYIEERCVLSSTRRSNNIVIYGHHMKTGGMFSSLINYSQESYYKQHPIIQFDTIYGDAEYEVFAMFAIDVVKEADFAYDTYTDLGLEDFEWFVNKVIARSAVSTGIRPTYGDELITLSTCEYSSDNGRYVVCARRVNE